MPALFSFQFPQNQAQAIFTSSLRFGLVGLLAFAVWAMPLRMSTAMLYISIAVVFLGCTGLFLYPLIRGPKRLIRFYAFFVPSFISYSLLWCLGWFGIRGHAGEIIGSAAGLASIVFIAQKLFRSKASFISCLGVLFFLHTLGYTLGSMFSYAAYGRGVLSPLMEGHGMLGKFLWGWFYGLGFGGGLGYLMYQTQIDSEDEHV